MAHAAQLEFVSRLKATFPDFFSNASVLDIGSLDINGSVRQFFQGGVYTGIDVAAGPGVDLVCQGQDFDAPDGSFDTVISCEAMEHNPFWKETFANMIRLCRPGGLVIATCATTGRMEHGTTRTTADASPLSVGIGWEYYRNLTASDFTRVLDLGASLEPFAFFSNWVARDLYFVGIRRSDRAPPHAASALAALRRHYRFQNLRHAFRSDYLVARLLIALLGEERYAFGRIVPWQ